MKKELFTKMVLVTPEIAKEMLKLNVSNRPLNEATVDYYAKQMINKQWTVIGQTISISDINTLIDGQHRLQAIVKSGCSIIFCVAYNVPFQSFVNYDTLKTRGVADVFAIEKIPNYITVSAIISKYQNFKNGSLSSMGFGSVVSDNGQGKTGGADKRMKLSNTDCLNIYKSKSELFQRVALEAQNCYVKIKLLSKSQIGAFMYHLINDKKHSEEKVFSFFRQLFYNENIENKSIYNLREKLINGSIGNLQMVPRLRYVFLVKCWNAYIVNKEIKVYSHNLSEPSPSFL